jgi:penicillin-binding protein 1A
MWDYEIPKPFYRRNIFLIPLFLVAGVVLAALLGWGMISLVYQHKVARFDIKKVEEMESASIIYDRNRKVLGRIFIQNRDAISIDNMPYAMVQAVVAQEDSRFFQHSGVDYFGVFRAALKNYRSGGIRQGASTLTQQLARNSFSLRERTYSRKLMEMFLAREVERHYSKNKILELYLNKVYFGAGFYGAEAAARGYFGKPARELTLSECATLAGLLKSPNNLSPWSNHAACVRQRDYVLGRMLELGMITKEQHDVTVASRLAVRNRSPIHTESYAIDHIRQQVMAQVGRDRAISDGYRIYTTIDADLQKVAEQSLKEQLAAVEKREGYDHQTYAEYQALTKARAKKNGSGEAESASEPTLPASDYLQGAVVALDNSTGGMLVLVGGRDFQDSQYDRAISAARPAGTAFIPLVYAAAFEKGVFPGMLFQDSVMDNRQVMIGGTTGILGEWGPERVDNRYEGSIPARAALVKSKNAATVRVGLRAGIDNLISLAKSAGINSEIRRFNSSFLGSSEVTLLDLTLAYTSFPNAGTRPKRAFVLSKIEDKEGQVIFEEKLGRARVMRDTTAYEVHSCLADVLEVGTADMAFTTHGLRKFPLGGKTGTAYNFTDVWFLGYSSAVTCGVWAGYDKPSSIYRGAFSNEIALPVWVKIMNASFANYRPVNFPTPPGIEKYEICRTSGLLATEKCVQTAQDKITGDAIENRTTYFEIATAEQAPKLDCDHGNTQQQDLVKETVAPQGEWPRAALAVEVSSVQPVAIKGPVVIGDYDPYESVKATTAGQATKVGQVAQIDSVKTGGAAPESAPSELPEVRRAEPVRPIDRAGSDSLIKLEPPPPLEF